MGLTTFFYKTKKKTLENKKVKNAFFNFKKMPKTFSMVLTLGNVVV